MYNIQCQDVFFKSQHKNDELIRKVHIHISLGYSHAIRLQSLVCVTYWDSKISATHFNKRLLGRYEALFFRDTKTTIDVLKFKEYYIVPV